MSASAQLEAQLHKATSELGKAKLTPNTITMPPSPALVPLWLPSRRRRNYGKIAMGHEQAREVVRAVDNASAMLLSEIAIAEDPSVGKVAHCR